MERTLSRRALLGAVAGGAALAAGGAFAGCSGRRVEELSGSLRSRHVPGHDVRWRMALPLDGPDELEPAVIVLHGRGGDADSAFDALRLQDHVQRTRLVIASVEGGDHYWHRRRSGVDPGAMVVEDFLPLVARESGHTGKVAFLGWSMGGYGSLLLASELGPDRVGAVVAESAALWTDPSASAPGAFDDREDFLAHDVFRRTDVLASIPVRLDCGRDDAFARANEAFGAALPSAQLTLDEGGHTTDYWRSHAAAQLAWIGDRLGRERPGQ